MTTSAPPSSLFLDRYQAMAEAAIMIGSEERRRILAALEVTPCQTITQLADATALALTSLLPHAGILERLGVIVVERQSTHHIVGLLFRRYGELRECLADTLDLDESAPVTDAGDLPARRLRPVPVAPTKAPAPEVATAPLRRRAA